MRTCIRRLLLFSAALWCAGCTQLPPSPADIQAKKFETLPDRAVIYIVRNDPDFSRDGATLLLDDTVTITTYPGTYYRWEVAAGAHRIAGFAADAGNTTIKVEAGKIYFVQQSFVPGPFTPRSHFHHVPASRGRSIVMRGELVGGR
jgi:hypothetical protein